MAEEFCPMVVALVSSSQLSGTSGGQAVTVPEALHTPTL